MDRQRSSNRLCPNYKPNISTVEEINIIDNSRHDLDLMEFECRFCKASFWKNERLAASSNKNFKFGMCCKQGRVSLPKHPEPPEPLKSLLMIHNKESIGNY